MLEAREKHAAEDGYRPKLEPWAHQRRALEVLRGRKGFALLAAMRTGKTCVTLTDFGQLWAAGEVDDLLIVAPAGVYRTWVGEIEKHVGEPLGSRLRVKAWAASEGTGKANALRWEAFMNPGQPRCLLVNVEALSTVKRVRDLVLAYCRQRRVYAAIDESTTIKSARSRRARFLVQLIAPLCRYRRILTGLVAPRDPGDVFMQFEFLKPACLGFASYMAFQARYAVTTQGYGRGSQPGTTQQYTKIVGWRDQDDLKRRMAEVSFRVRLQDCTDLPPKIYQTREVELTPEQDRIYEELHKYACVQLSEQVWVSATQAATQVLRLHQVLCGHVGDETGVRREVETNRVAVLLDLLTEWDQGGKAVIWCAYDQDVKAVTAALHETYGAGTVARFWGGNRPTREDEERAFLTEPLCRFMVATAAAGGRGRTWANADLVVYFSNDYSLEHREQSEERTQAIGKSNSVLYVDLVAKRRNGTQTVDDTILYCLRNKMTMAALLQGDGWRKWVR
jgi:SNF2 family DNA or RNA helicase